MIIRQLLSLCIIIAASACHAASYKWIDRDSTLHFSDTPPSYEVPKSTLSIEDNEQRPLMGTGHVIYRDRIFKVVLADEQQDKLLFDVEYSFVLNMDMKKESDGSKRIELGKASLKALDIL